MPTVTATDRLKVLFAGICSLILTLGIARFAYTPLLPVLQSQTGLNDADAGNLAAINYLGYLAGVLLASTTTSLARKDMYYRVGMVLGVVSTAAMALTDQFLWWSLFRFIQGLAATSGLIIGSGLILHWLLHNRQKSAMGIHFIGMGAGIAVSAMMAMLLGDSHWQLQWLIYAALATVLAIPALAWLPKPDFSGTKPSPVAETGAPNKLWMLLLVTSYGCAGVGYVISATFMVTIVERIPALAGDGNMIWLIVGLTAAPSVIIWERIADRIGTLHALMLAYGLQLISVMLPVWLPTSIGLLGSALLWGGTFIGIVALVLMMVGKLYPSKPATLMGRLTLSFSVAQIAAPAAAGYLAQQQGNYNASLYMAACAMVVGALLLLAMQLTSPKALASV